MTQFVRENFHYHGGYLHYSEDGSYQNHKFVARFKYQGSACRPYITFLIKNFTVEEFFALADAHEQAQRDGSAFRPGYTGGTWNKAEERGFIMPHIKKWLREGGYQVSREGYKQFRDDRLAATLARLDAQKAA